MALSLGSSLATKVYLGATEINLAYFGATQVYSSASFSAEAQNYFDRLDTAGDTTYVDYKQPLANYIDGLVTLGGAYWDDMLSATSFVGVGIQGVTVPLRDGMTVPTNNNFVAGNLNQLTGLKGDASTKYISTGVNATSLSLNDNSISVYLTESRDATNKRYMGNSVAANSIEILANSTGFRSKNFSSQLDINGTSVSSSGIIGISRDNSANYDWRYETSGNVANTSVLILGGTINVFKSDSIPTAARLATYHVGPALNLATLEGLQNTLISEVEAVWNTLVYQSDFANGATEWTAARGTNTAPDSPDASTNVMSYVPYVGIQTHYTRLSTSNINLTDEYLTQFEIYIPSSNVTVEGFLVTDWTSTTVLNNTIPTSDTWTSISFISKYENVGIPAIWQTAAGSSTFNGNGTDKIYIRNFRVSEQS